MTGVQTCALPICSLEELAIELACQRMTEEEVDALEQTQEEFKAAVACGDAMKIAETDETYHDVIYKGTGNDRLVQILNNLREQMYRYRLEYIKDEDKRQILLLEHDKILKAVKLRRVEEAKEAMREHIDNPVSYTHLTVWELSDIWNGLMALPNIAALIFLMKEVTFPKGKEGEIQTGKN